MNELQSFRINQLRSVDTSIPAQKQQQLMQSIKKGKLARLQRERYVNRRRVNDDQYVYIIPSNSAWERHVANIMLPDVLNDIHTITDNCSIEDVLKVIGTAKNIVFLIRIPNVCRQCTCLKERYIILMPLTNGFNVGKQKIDEVWCISSEIEDWVVHLETFEPSAIISKHTVPPRYKMLQRKVVRKDGVYLHIMNGVLSQTDLVFRTWYMDNIQVLLGYIPELLILADINSFFAIYQLYRNDITSTTYSLGGIDIPFTFHVKKYNIYVSFHAFDQSVLKELAPFVKCLIQPNQDDVIAYMALTLNVNLITSNKLLRGYQIQPVETKQKISCRYKNTEMYFFSDSKNAYPHMYSNEDEIVKKIGHIERTLVRE